MKIVSVSGAMTVNTRFDLKQQICLWDRVFSKKFKNNRNMYSNNDNLIRFHAH